jgi:transposase-like protein
MQHTRAVVHLTCPHCRADTPRTAPEFRKWPHSFRCGVCGETVCLSSVELVRALSDLKSRGTRERSVTRSA